MSVHSFLNDDNRYRQNGSQTYRFGFSPDELWAYQYPTYNYCRSLRRQVLNCLLATGSKLRSDKNKLHINLDVKLFTLDELSVKTVDGYVIVKAKHGNKKGSQRWGSRQFTRKFQLPEGCNAENVQCRLSYDGVLTVTVPLGCGMKSIERVVPIIQTGPLKSRFETKVDGGDEDEKRDGAIEDASEKTPVGDGE